MTPSIREQLLAGDYEVVEPLSVLEQLVLNAIIYWEGDNYPPPSKDLAVHLDLKRNKVNEARGELHHKIPIIRAGF